VFGSESFQFRMMDTRSVRLEDDRSCYRLRVAVLRNVS